ncbi:MAG: HXXEE domain-containing protein [Gemmatimonadales bacterium]
MSERRTAPGRQLRRRSRVRRPSPHAAPGATSRFRQPRAPGLRRGVVDVADRAARSHRRGVVPLSHMGDPALRDHVATVLCLVAPAHRRDPWRICSRAAAPLPSRASALSLLVAASALLTNLGFHLASSVAFREYSPGLGTAWLYLPVTVSLWGRARALLTSGQRRRAALIGIALSALITATLLLDVPI